MPFVITSGCEDVKDRACVDQCPVDCIYESDRMMVIQPDECIDCGACEPVCPQTAIFHEALVPEALQSYVAFNREESTRVAAG